jgi:HD-like signal output (HDOD) protein
MGGAIPPRPSVAGLSESDLVTLYSVGAVRALAAGDCLVPAHGATDATYFVVEGPFEIRAANGDVIGVVGRGECIDVVTGDGALPYTVVARDTASVVHLTPFGFDLLPPPTQRALGRLAIASSVRRFDALATRYGEGIDRNARLVASVKNGAGRAGRLLAVPQLREALAEIPALPVHATEITAKLLDDRTRADDVVESIKNDPALASLVLKRVNSAYYGLETKVSDHYRALLLLGTASVYQLILESAIESVIPERPESRAIQERASVVSVLAYEIALLSRQANPLVASTIGLLHNIGESLALLIRERKPDVAELVACVESPALGAAVLAGWGLPERVHEVVERQEQAQVLLPAELEAHAAETSVLYLARVCHDVLLGGATPPAHAAAYMAKLGLREASCASFCRDILAPALAKKAEALPAAVRARLGTIQE